MAKIELYSTTYCGYCNAAKKCLSDMNIDFVEFDVTQNPEKRTWLVQTTGQRTVPQIFVNDKPIGGYHELNALIQSGEFGKLILK